MITIIVKGILFSALLIYAAYTDIKKREIDDWICVSILVISLMGTGGSFLGGVLTALPFFIPALIKNGSIGGGDIKLMFACGAFLGVWGGVLQSIIALLIVLIYGLFIAITKGYKVYKNTAIPLAPFLCAGGIASYLIVNFGGV